MSVCRLKHTSLCLRSLCFLRAAAMQARTSYDKAVGPSVCPSVCPSHACIMTKRTKVLLPYEWSIVFRHEEWLVGDVLFYLKLWAKLTHRFKNGDVLSKKVCCKVSLRENFQRRSCKAFTGLSNRVQMVGGDVPFYLKFWTKVTQLFKKRRFTILYSPVPRYP